jgi:hypothetical protein
MESFQHLVRQTKSVDRALEIAFAGLPVFVEPGHYFFSDTHLIKDGCKMKGHGDAYFAKMINSAGDDGTIAYGTGHIDLEGLNFALLNTESLYTTYEPLFVITDATGSFINLRAASARRGCFEFIDCESLEVRGGWYGNSRGNAFTLDNVAHSNFRGVEIRDNLNFGFWLINSCADNEFRKVFTKGNGLELVGITSGCNRNRVLYSSARGCGDNGISISGDRNIAFGNFCRSNDHDGIGIFGDENVVSGNVCEDNGDGNGIHAGIAVRASTGGGNRNAVYGNISRGSHDFGFIVKSEGNGNVLFGNVDHGSVGGKYQIEDISRLGDINVP